MRKRAARTRMLVSYVRMVCLWIARRMAMKVRYWRVILKVLAVISLYCCLAWAISSSLVSHFPKKDFKYPAISSGLMRKP
jgi:hypothetical protein